MFSEKTTIFNFSPTLICKLQNPAKYGHQQGDGSFINMGDMFYCDKKVACHKNDRH
jgi:hypothetical protein